MTKPMIKVSIPQSGFWLFRPILAAYWIPSMSVSIPQSGFWLFRQLRLGKLDRVTVSFNPSIGILVVQT